jgi:hypothetical protein
MAERVGIKANLRREVQSWLRDEELRTGLSKTMLVTAALAALRVLPKRERDAVVKWAKLLDEELSSWADFERACDETAKDRAESLERGAVRALQRGIEASREEQKVPGPATSRKRA